MWEIFQFDFMIRAFIAGAVVSLIAPLIGNFLVVRGYSLMADTLAHVALAGVAIGMLTRTQPIIIAVITTIVAALCIDRLRMQKKIVGESILALFLSGSLAVATVLLSFGKAFTVDLFSFLFGSIVTVTSSDVVIIVVLGAVVVILLSLFYKELFFSSFDEELAAASGIPVRIMNTMLVVLTAVTVALSMRIVGVLLIGALMVIPVITATQFGRGFQQTVLLSILFSIFSIFLGLFISYYFGLASGGTIVVISLFFFLPALFLKKTS